MKATHLIFIFTLLSSLNLFAQASQSKTLIVGLGLYYTEPFAIYDKDQKIKSGIVYDLMKGLCEEYDCNIEYISIPRKRIEKHLSSGKVHILPRSNEKWISAQDIQWSIPWTSGENVFLYRADKIKGINSIDDLKSEKVGLVHGYYYEKLNGFLKDGQVQADTAPNMNKNIKRFQQGWINIIYGSKRILDYKIKNFKLKNTAFSNFLKREFEIHMAISKNSILTKEQIDLYIKKIQKNGKLDLILNKY